MPVLFQEAQAAYDPQPSRVCVVILNWNGLQDTLECLRSVLETDYKNFEIVVVDNGSTDGSVERIPSEFPQLRFIATGKNLGWAGGNNVGIRFALANNYQYVFLLNNDTVISPDCISRLVEAAVRVGPSLLHPAIYYYDEPTIAQLDPTVNLPTLGKPTTVSLDHAYGAALFVDATLFEEVGLIDERFFLQLEETDFYFRAKAIGIGANCATGARLLHKESRAFGGKITPIKTYYIVRNSLLVLSKHHVAMGGYLIGLRKLLWTLNGMISKARNMEPVWRLTDLVWLFTSNHTARAIRFGVSDFILGKFGALRDSIRAKIQNP